MQDGERKGQECPLGRRPLTRGGRDDAGICLPFDSGISRRHCQIIHDGKGLCIEDLGSANGT